VQKADYKTDAEKSGKGAWRYDTDKKRLAQGPPNAPGAIPAGSKPTMSPSCGVTWPRRAGVLRLAEQAGRATSIGCRPRRSGSMPAAPAAARRSTSANRSMPPQAKLRRRPPLRARARKGQARPAHREGRQLQAQRLGPLRHARQRLGMVARTPIARRRRRRRAPSSSASSAAARGSTPPSSAAPPTAVSTSPASAHPTSASASRAKRKK